MKKYKILIICKNRNFLKKISSTGQLCLKKNNGKIRIVSYNYYCKLRNKYIFKKIHQLQFFNDDKKREETTMNQTKGRGFKTLFCDVFINLVHVTVLKRPFSIDLPFIISLHLVNATIARYYNVHESIELTMLLYFIIAFFSVKTVQHSCLQDENDALDPIGRFLISYCSPSKYVLFEEVRNEFIRREKDMDREIEEFDKEYEQFIKDFKKRYKRW